MRNRELAARNGSLSAILGSERFSLWRIYLRSTAVRLRVCTNIGNVMPELRALSQ